MKKTQYQYVDDKISSILKYSGKTNEIFTKMMINVALLTSNFDYNTKIRLLDPVAGKATTLFEGTVYGFDVTGIEINAKLVHETKIFFKKFIEKERFKHKYIKKQIYGKSKTDAIYVHDFEYSKNKEDFKLAEKRKKFNVINACSTQVDKYFKKNYFNLIVGDLPYGIVHGNSTGKNKFTGITRNPVEMLSLCLPKWYNVLKKGGVLVVAWNSFLVSPKKMKTIFNDNNFDVMSDYPFDNFEHLIDKSIKRDIIVAKKR